jgi:hypothetical protein
MIGNSLVPIEVNGKPEHCGKVDPEPFFCLGSFTFPM